MLAAAICLLCVPWAMAKHGPKHADMPVVLDLNITVIQVPQEVVTLYGNRNYGGWSTSFPVGSYTRSDLLAAGGEDNDVDSVKVAAGYKLELFDDDKDLPTGLQSMVDSMKGAYVSANNQDWARTSPIVAWEAS